MDGIAGSLVYQEERNGSTHVVIPLQPMDPSYDPVDEMLPDRHIDNLLSMNRVSSSRSRPSMEWMDVEDGFVRALTFGEMAEADCPEDEMPARGTEKSILSEDVRSVVRSTLFSMVMIALGLTTLFIIMLLLFFSVAWQLKNNYGGIKLVFLDLDGGSVGAAILSALNSTAMPFSYTVLPPTTTLAETHWLVDRGDCNLALVVSAGATQSLMAAVLDTKATYNPTAAASFIFDHGRSGASMAAIIRNTTNALVSGVSSRFAASLLTTLADNSAVLLPAVNPQALTFPIGLTEVNLHPVAHTGQFTATDFALVDCWIIVLATNTAMFAVLQKWDEARIRRDHQLLAQLVHQVVITGCLSFWPPAIMAALGGQFSPAQFFTWWAFLWLAMATFGIVIVTLLRTLGIKLGAAVQSIFLLVNFVASPAVAAPELVPHFFRVGQGLLLNSAIQGSRTIIFGSYDVLGRCIGVLVAWAGGALLLLAFHVRRQKSAAAVAAAAAAALASGRDRECEATADEGGGDAERGMLSAEVRVVLRGTLRTMGVVTVILSALFAVMLLLFFGVGWQQRDYYGNVRLAYLDLDGGAVGAALLSAVESSAMPFALEVLPPGTLPAEVHARVGAGEWNVALVARPGASRALLAAAADPAAAYAAADASEYVFDQGRGGASLATIIRTALQGLVVRVGAAVGAATVASLAKKGVPLARVNPAVVAAAVGYTEVNLHPVPFTGEFIATELVLVNCWIIVLASNTAMFGVLQRWDEARIRRDHQLLAQLANQLVVTLAVALWPPVILAGLGAPLSAEAFFTWWAFLWLAMATFGIVIVTLLRTLGVKLGAATHSLFLLINFVSSPSLVARELVPPFFQVGLGLPLNSAVQGSRTIVFGSYDVLGRCIGVLVAWAGGALLLLAFHARSERAHFAAATAAAAAKELRASSSAGAGGSTGVRDVGPTPSDRGTKTAAAPTAPVAAPTATPPPQTTPVEVFGGGGEAVAAGAAAAAAATAEGVASSDSCSVLSAESRSDAAGPFLVPPPEAPESNSEAVWGISAGAEAWPAWPGRDASDW